MPRNNEETRENIFSKSYDFFHGKTKLANFVSVDDAFFHRPRMWVINLICLLAGIAVFIWICNDLNLINDLNQYRNWDTVGYIFSCLFTPDWSLFFGYGSYKFSESVVYMMYQTFGMAFIGTLLAAILALPFGLFASHKLFPHNSWMSEIFLILIRTFPEVLLALIFVAFSGLNVLTGILALGFHSIGMIGKLYSEQIDDMNMEPLEALDACGASSYQRIHLGVIPQVMPNLLSVALYRFDINVRTATILGMVVQGCGIGYALQIYAAKWHQMGACILGIIILIIIIDLFSSWLRKKIV
jgi:phosphonate transport system permease protein